MSRLSPSRMLDMATGAAVGSLIACASMLFYPSVVVLSLMVIGLGTLGGLIGYFWQTYFQI